MDWKIACMRKLALWQTHKFTPLTYHEELEPIMISLGFVPHPPENMTADCNAGCWKAYSYSTWTCRESSPSDLPLPRPSLPYPRIDGLHVFTYLAFLDDVSFYLQKPDLFHLRGLSLEALTDIHMTWSRMEEEEDGIIFVYRHGTLDKTLKDKFEIEKDGQIRRCFKKSGCDKTLGWGKDDDPISSSSAHFVPLDDIIAS